MDFNGLVEKDDSQNKREKCIKTLKTYKKCLLFAKYYNKANQIKKLNNHKYKTFETAAYIHIRKLTEQENEKINKANELQAAIKEVSEHNKKKVIGEKQYLNLATFYDLQDEAIKILENLNSAISKFGVSVITITKNIFSVFLDINLEDSVVLDAIENIERLNKIFSKQKKIEIEIKIEIKIEDNIKNKLKNELNEHIQKIELNDILSGIKNVKNDKLSRLLGGDKTGKIVGVKGCDNMVILYESTLNNICKELVNVEYCIKTLKDFIDTAKYFEINNKYYTEINEIDKNLKSYNLLANFSLHFVKIKDMITKINFPDIDDEILKKYKEGKNKINDNLLKIQDVISSSFFDDEKKLINFTKEDQSKVLKMLKETDNNIFKASWELIYIEKNKYKLKKDLKLSIDKAYEYYKKFEINILESEKNDFPDDLLEKSSELDKIDLEINTDDLISLKDTLKYIKDLWIYINIKDPKKLKAFHIKTKLPVDLKQESDNIKYINSLKLYSKEEEEEEEEKLKTAKENYNTHLDTYVKNNTQYHADLTLKNAVPYINLLTIHLGKNETNYATYHTLKNAESTLSKIVMPYVESLEKEKEKNDKVVFSNKNQALEKAKKYIEKLGIAYKGDINELNEADYVEYIKKLKFHLNINSEGLGKVKKYISNLNFKMQLKELYL